MLEHDTLEPDATLVVPVHGELELVLSAEHGTAEGSWFTGRFTSLDDSEGDTEIWFDDEEGRQVSRMQLVPGHYQVQLLPNRLADRELFSEPFGGARVLEVRARELTSLTLGG